MFNVGDKVVCVAGGESSEGIVERIDKQTYSIPVYTVRLTSGRFVGELVAKPQSALSLIQRDFT